MASRRNKASSGKVGARSPASGSRSPRKAAGGLGRAAARQAGSGNGAGGSRIAAALRLRPEELRWTCKPIAPSGTPPTAAFLLDQDRPMQALRTGLSIHAPGYNLFVSGLMGSGRMSVVEHLLRDIQPFCKRGPDRLYLHNFREPNRPLLINVPPGRGASFREDLQELARVSHHALNSALRSGLHRMSRRLVMRSSEEREQRIMAALNREAAKLGCALVRFQAQSGGATADIYPVVEGEPITVDALSTLVIEGKVTAEDRDRLLRARAQLLDRLEEVSDRLREQVRVMRNDLREMDRKLAFQVLQGHGKDFRARWPQPEIADWLDVASEYVELHLSRWISLAMPDAVEGQEQAEEPQEEPQPQGRGRSEPKMIEFVAQLVKASTSDACPLVVESNPTFGNLFGTIGQTREGPQSVPTLIHPGALLRADGGYLILRCVDVLREPGVWGQLKRTLQTGMLEIREFDQNTGQTGGTLQPEAIPIDLKVVLIGEPGVYEVLAEEDPQFVQIFKIHAEFDATIPAHPENLTRYADYLVWLAGHEKLKAFGPDAAAAIAEYGARAAGRRDRLITRYSELGDLAREASHRCERMGQRKVTRAHVEEAMRAIRYRHDLSQEQIERDYAAGYMQLATSGAVVGQINALTALDTGTLEFGRPCRLTCNTGIAVASRSGLINIEGEVELSGPIHDKGVMILEGYLLQEFGADGPLCMQATICFEQLYNGVEGDSASLAQLLALLSSLSGVPLDQGLALTGSINQKGDVQAVGAVNAKIEGFYRLCLSRKLSGSQGVVLPRANVGDLMLDPEVVDAVARGAFRVHAVRRVEEALELATGRPAREVLELVRARLAAFRRAVGVGPTA